MINVTFIERFATHDGPGIRTTVFLKGCTLFCPWCANPETQRLQSDLFYDSVKCVSCRECEQVCSTNAITFTQGKFHYDEKKCTHCHTCVDTCLKDALEFQGKYMSEEEVLKEVLKDKAYYEQSNGGLTISGGEPLVQKDALFELLRMAKKAGLSTAIETTGNYPLLHLQHIMPFTDYFLYDFKHLDDTILKSVTGGNGKQIKDNLVYLLKVNAHKVQVRMPIIPGFNYDEKLIYKTIDYLKSIGVQRVDFLPYHSLGKSKYEKMGKIYTLPNKMMQKEELEKFALYARNKGIKSIIGA